MTLVLGLLAENWVAIAADRMLSIPPIGKPQKRDATKLVFFYNAFIFGYTGAAVLPDRTGKLVDTGRWLVDVLSGVGKKSLPVAFEVVRRDGTEALQRLARNFPNQVIPHEFVGVGFGQTSMDGPLRPMFCNITNRCEPDRTLRATLSPQLSVLVSAHDVPPGEVGSEGVQTASLHWAGFTRTTEETKWLWDRIVKAAERGRSPLYALNLMKDSIRQTSSRLHDHYVGKDVLGAILSRTAANSNSVCVGNIQSGSSVIFEPTTGQSQYRPQSEWAWFMRYPDGRDQGVYEAPHVVCLSYATMGISVPQPVHGQTHTVAASMWSGEKASRAMMNIKANREKTSRGKHKPR